MYMYVHVHCAWSSFYSYRNSKLFALFIDMLLFVLIFCVTGTVLFSHKNYATYVL